MPKMKYVGTKADGERAFVEKTGIVWLPGSEHDVSAAHAALMAPHGDVWEEVTDARPDPRPTLAGATSKFDKADSEQPDIEAMTDEAVRALAKDRGYALHSRLAGANLRAKFREAAGA